MRFRFLLLPAVLAFTVSIFTNPAFAETIVDFDVVVDTTWTKEMSPIIVKGSTRNDKIRRVTSGAVLTIEPGVEVQFDSGMSLHITSQCLRGYGGEACYRGGDGEIRMPKLIARGTSTQPIIFTSKNKAPGAGDWGSVIIDARGSEIKWAEFRYGGMRSKRAFVEVNNSLFENNLIENGGEAIALFVSSQKIERNVIRRNGGDGIFCSHQCEVKDNFISENFGDAIELDTLIETKITGNFIYKNSGNGITNEGILSVPVTAEGNFFRENAGGIYFHRSSLGCEFLRNNFLQNSNFAIKSDINNRVGKIYSAEGNWFGIDVGAQNLIGQFFVSVDYDVSKFAAEGNDFSIAGASKAARIYREYLAENNLENAFFEAKPSRKNFIGNENLPGSLLRYSVTLGNRTTKARSGVELAVSMPTDQNLLLCSAQAATPNFNYSLQNACTTTLSSEISFENNRLVWRPNSIAALEEQTLFFVMMIKPTAKTTASLPRLDFNGKPFSYQIGSNIQLEEAGGDAVLRNSNSEVQKIQEVQVVQSEKVEVQPASVSTVPADDGSLATGVVSRQIVNGILNYVLTTADGMSYTLYNSLKWREIDNFTKSENKDRPIAVYGDFYINRYGVTTGIKFTRFEVR
ncbi:right-handed parallel beta-helix repeat-containing protein [Candidatus Gracilibacteria bacterium]|nr:right-handed parallel beta-helix repeat-containing protein [Candidatus Gracilibacteria bacterium]